jgi:hypothetical protein
MKAMSVSVIRPHDVAEEDLVHVGTLDMHGNRVEVFASADMFVVEVNGERFAVRAQDLASYSSLALARA